jgi:hypothetical protein
VQGGLRGVLTGGLAGAQQLQHPVEFGHRLQGVPPDRFEAEDEFGGRIAHPVWRRLGLNRDHRHVVRDHIVQLAGDPGSLLEQ